MSRNRLAWESSPYLQQHADNPVDWYPWGEEALALARKENKPILLSVGYAACHWCHVMAHESFENPEIAELMNAHFVNIKLDREERPDLDHLYQQALALLGEQGGWPLTMFLTPSAAPFWGGTYFPREPRYGRPGFAQVLNAVSEAFHQRPEAVGQNVEALTEALERLAQPEGGSEITAEQRMAQARRLLREIDPFEGGFGRAPKFPQPMILKLLWYAWHASGDPAFRQAVELSLRKMSQGGIYDHLGGGFARYSTDNRWLVPHFEKMLYDNAQLLDLLNWAWQAGRDPLFEQRAKETVAWMLREMQAEDRPGGVPCGGFAASLDADSEGEEGRFYVWSEAEIDALLGDKAAFFKDHYDVSAAGNWEGKVILNRSHRPDLLDPAAEAVLAECRARLFEARESRPHPGWDDKVLADWNGLTIAALARAAGPFQQPEWLQAAQAAFDFVVSEMDEGGRLFHAWRHGQRKHAATLDDYAQMAEAALALEEATGEARYRQQALVWVETALAHFWDEEKGGFFLTADDARDLVVRPKHAQDNATPAGNGTMAAVLARLWHLSGEPRWREAAERSLAAFSGEMERSLFAFPGIILSSAMLEDALQLVIVGRREDEETRILIQAAQCGRPDLVLQVVEDTSVLPAGHPAAGKGALAGQATAFLCRGVTCSLPMTEAEALNRALAEPAAEAQAGG
ncbi:thioredoxin domain-containing protein [Aquibaculum arenosum]|uniref:Thioredoxin domain-containing protein n=1 Tax=Aquibaculum arenosum TaxID=3032591 RepID=A0ABT5YKW1_9PROT|nr:thioredoxin domain-containing protein [Fodinicurvata sp. CAU 1616]MDF2095585.1 thioredoxin domain-containing protein [Fodinicurvata sp. CAU 1616]